jgi:rod shape determining protein RodA
VAESRFGLIIALMVGAGFAIQVVVKLGLVHGHQPPPRINPPQFSSGGSSLLSTCVALGVVQSVWRHRLVNQ